MMPREAMASALRQPVLPYAAVLLLTALWGAIWLPRGGFSGDVLLELTRLTARTAVFFFLAAFSASALLVLTRSAPARFLVANRRHVGLAFALAHFIHLGVLVAYFAVTGEDPGTVRIVGGGLAYLLIALMAVTSTNGAQRWLGPNWRRLHLVGSWYVWLVFLNSYLGRVLEGREPVWIYGGITALMLGAAALRIAAGMQKRARLRAVS
jgi:methionine sulfoxide reductase heme-binding subunit